jgi:pimeloyl-ACP methyl ester carboxylesterase
MQTITSKDGTKIAYEQAGQGPALILVSGAIVHRAIDQSAARLVALLAKNFTVYNFDRRGRGDSTDTQPYAVKREIEDIEALIDHAGGSAFLYGISSGAALAMEAVIALPGKVRKLVMYEPPYNDDAPARQGWKEYRRGLTDALAEGRRGDAVGLFMTLVGTPPEAVAGMRQQPMWPMLEGISPTIAYDAAIMGEEAAVPVQQAGGVLIPTLVMTGGASYPFMHEAARTLTGAIPDARHKILEGQTHDVSPDVIAPEIIKFLAS